MTRRLAAAALIAGSLGLFAAPAVAGHHDNSLCIGGDRGPGQMYGYCIADPRSVVEIGRVVPPPPPR